MNQGALPFGIDVGEDGSVLDFRRPSVWVASPDIAAAGGRIVTTIVIALHFENEDAKPMVMEANVNWSRLALAFGPRVARWVGARVVLFNEPTAIHGTRCLGVRIRAARDGE
jgi:hypothetical protein